MYSIHEFHNLRWITEINVLFHNILIDWDATVHTRLRRPLCPYTSRHPCLLRLQSSCDLALNTLSITRATWLNLTLLISPLELPVLCWNGWLFVTLTARDLVSVRLAVRGKRNEKTWIYRSGLAGQLQFNTPFVMRSSSQLWSLCLIRINPVGKGALNYHWPTKELATNKIYHMSNAYNIYKKKNDLEKMS